MFVGEFLHGLKGLKRLMEKSDNIVIAGGGTGGHIYPALAIAQSIQKLNPKYKIHFVGTPAGLEKEIVPKYGFPLHLINVGKLNKNMGLWIRLKTLVLMPFSFFQCLLLLKKLNPKFALGVGGYASGPFVLIASIFGVPAGIWEPNAFPGLANRILKLFVKHVFVVFRESREHFGKIDVKAVGLPVRAQMKSINHEIGPRKFRVLIFGGSQGARAINKVVVEALTKDKNWYDDIEFVHQIGNVDYDWAKESYTDCSQNINYFRYLDDMEKRYSWADLVICRGGISTLAELAACRRAGVIIPLPTAADNHQQKNAEVLVNAGAAKMILQKDFNAETFKRIILDFKSHPEKIAEIEKNVPRFYSPDAAAEIGQFILKEIN